MDARTTQAIETMEKIISGQEQARKRLWPNMKFSTKITGTSNIDQNPELSAIAPYPGIDIEIGGYIITRRQVDWLDNFYFWRV